LTTKQYNYIERLDRLISTFNGHDLTDLLAKIKFLENESLINLNESEIVYFMSVTNLAKHSLDYWNSSKAEKWHSFIKNKRNSPFTEKVDWHNVAVADIAAFIVGFPAGVKIGALTGGLAAGIASGGITAGLGAVLGGFVGGTVSGLAAAASASAVALAAEVSADWFGW
jgi:hypothetical protein